MPITTKAKKTEGIAPTPSMIRQPKLVGSLEKA
jgi:hypothetical protein